jgi:hypothetical protein
LRWRISKADYHLPASRHLLVQDPSIEARTYERHLTFVGRSAIGRLRAKLMSSPIFK